jgi:hypothetical protein
MIDDGSMPPCSHNQRIPLSGKTQSLRIYRGLPLRIASGMIAATKAMRHANNTLCP